MANEVDSRSTIASSPIVVFLAWVGVGVPLLWGVAQTIRKALVLFQ